MQARNWFLAGTISLVSCFVPVGAQVLSYELRGTVDQVSDSTGLLGSPLQGEAFTLTYFADFSKGYRYGSFGGYSHAASLTGGTSFGPNPYFFPEVRPTPVSAVLQIGDHEIDFLGSSYGSLVYASSSLNVLFGGGLPSSSIELFANTTQAGGSAPLSSIRSAVNSPYSDSIFGLMGTPGNYVLDGTSLWGSTSFSYLSAAGTAQETLVAGNLIPTSFSITAPVPEPETWMLLAIGLAGLLVLKGRLALAPPAQELVAA